MTDNGQEEKCVVHKAGDDEVARLEALVQAMGNSKDAGYFERQFECQAKGLREIYVVVVEGADAGYCILNWTPKYALFKRIGIPEIQDLNVLPAYRRRGLASRLIAYCEARAREKGMEHMGIGVGMHPGYGPAQRLYVKLGYAPDGNGVTYDRQPTTPGEFRPVDDQLCLMMVKAL